MSKTRYAYDTEFIENGRTIDLISMGIVCEDGREYYAVNKDMPIHRIREHPWLMSNVVPSLPTKEIPFKDKGILVIDEDDPTVRCHHVIAREVRDFLTAGEHEPELWAFYSAYDHVAYAQLWGPMADLPRALPKRTRDLADALDTFDAWSDLPRQDPSTLHNALDDARHVMESLRMIDWSKKLWIAEQKNPLA